MLGVNARWLASGEGLPGVTPAPVEAPAAPPEGADPDLEAALLRSFRALTPDGRLAFARLIDAAARQSSASETLDVEIAAATRGSVIATRRDALELLRAWLSLSEADRVAHKRRIETDALRHRAPAETHPFPTAPTKP